MFQSPKRIFLVANQNQRFGARQSDLETRNETKPYQRDELHPKTLFKNFETGRWKPQIEKRLLRP